MSAASLIRLHLLRYIAWVSDVFLAAMALAYLVFIFVARDQFNAIQLVIFFGLGLIAIVLLSRALLKKLGSHKG